MPVASEHHDVTRTTVQLGAVQVPEITLRVQGSPQPGIAVGIHAVTVGSGDDCDLRLEDEAVSRRHCSLQLTDTGVLLRDLQSTNGTWLGNVRLLEANVPPGALITLGDTRLELVATGEVHTLALSRAARFGEAVGSSAAMRALFARLERIAPSEESVVLVGESGTGKEVLARGIHDGSPRRAGPFVVLDCTTLAGSLSEAELFGHAKGSFTGAVDARAGVFEAAHGGSIFVDEIGELALEHQAKLLRVLEQRSIRRIGENQPRAVDLRLIAATHRNLRSLVQSGQFREDLFYRLSVIELRVPPLRERLDDLPLLVERFLAEQTPLLTLDALPTHALEMLRHHEWPGNVRELRNVVARLVLFPEEGTRAALAAPDSGSPGGLLTLPLKQARELLVEDFERRYLKARLDEFAGNVSKAAQAIGVSRQFLHRLLKDRGLGRDSVD